ncbi:MAG: iron-containing alcohol dehydrogenase, partial [Bacteroidales bacterium]|nr:iron-containing alcohol dehydrogenase [Bacteroidales bacterium]
NGVYEQVVEQLNNKNYIEFSGIEPNPTYETLMQAVEIARKEEIDFLLAVGGGSVIDGTKFIAAAIPFTYDDPWKLLSEQAKIEKAIPLGAILTLPATGSEMNATAVISHKALKQKLAFCGKSLFPKFSILDPETMYSIPKNQLANGIVDAFIHVLEQYLTYDVNSPVQDRFAEALLITLLEEGPKLMENPKNYDVCANIMWTATMSLNGLIAVGVPEDWATHNIGHELTALFNLDHGQSLAVVLPGLLREMKTEKSQKLLQFAERVWKMKIKDQTACIDKVIDETENFFKSLGLKTLLSEYDVKIEDIDFLCKRLDNQKLNWGENENINSDLIRKILISRF